MASGPAAGGGIPHLTDAGLRGETDATGTPVDTATLASQRLSGRMWSGDVRSSAGWN